MATFTWNVSQTNYETANGFITTAHWQCNAIDVETDKDMLRLQASLLYKRVPLLSMIKACFLGKL